MNLTRTARVTGLWYLGIALTGLFGFVLIRSRLFVEDDAGATLANLVEHASLARVGVALELGVVLTQAVTAAWFYRLFRSADPVGATGIAAFGLVNATAIMVSAALLGTAVEIANDPLGDAATQVQTLFLTTEDIWAAGNLFFGLWLIPMGSCVLRSRWMPRPLGWILIGGGAGYVLSAFLGFLVPTARLVTDLLVLPATVGEFWMIGYLLVRGVRPTDSAGAPGSVSVPAQA
jgi:hypothetical protein